MEKPILFNTEMVQAILEGRKIVTRRVIKRTPSNDEPSGYGFWKEFNERDNKWYVKDYTHSCIWWPLKEYIERFSKYHIGDILYVRETWGIQSMKNYGKRVKFLYKAEPNKELREVALSESRYDDMLKYSFKNGWQPSLFMPKEAARIFLEVTDIRVERLQDITEEGAREEGCIDFHDKIGDGKFEDVLEFDLTAKDAFSELWNSTVNKKDINLYGWDENPWVWVIKFKVKEVKN